MAVDVVPVVVRHVDYGVGTDLWRAARGVVDVIALESDGVLGTSHVHCPVVVAVAVRRPAGGTVHEVVGDGDSGVLAVAGDNVLTADQRGLKTAVSTARQIIFCWELTFTWSTQTLELPSSVIASPPQTY